tara:strand:- start:170 stop:568 length:399 start_codon:yes stop_codon:yes gene_type:complete
MSDKKLRKLLFGSNPSKFASVTKEEQEKDKADRKENKETAAAKKKYLEKKYRNEEELGIEQDLNAPITERSFPSAYKKYKAKRKAEELQVNMGGMITDELGYMQGGMTEEARGPIKYSKGGAIAGKNFKGSF